MRAKSPIRVLTFYTTSAVMELEAFLQTERIPRQADPCSAGTFCWLRDRMADGTGCVPAAFRPACRCPVEIEQTKKKFCYNKIVPPCRPGSRFPGICAEGLIVLSEFCRPQAMQIAVGIAATGVSSPSSKAALGASPDGNNGCGRPAPFPHRATGYGGHPPSGAPPRPP